MRGLEILGFDTPGYERMVEGGGWCVALANYCGVWERGRTTYLERHLETDEVFVLLEGEGSLLIGKEMTEVVMEKGKIYNVRCGEWHQLICSPKAKLLIVESDATSDENTERMYL